MKPLIVSLVALILLSCDDRQGKKMISAAEAPAALGPYSQAVEVDGTVYVAGQIALRRDGSIDTTTFENECAQTLQNISLILHAAEKKNADVCKVTVYLTDLKQYAVFNKVYARHFTSDFPAREVVAVKALLKGAHIEISVIAR